MSSTIVVLITLGFIIFNIVDGNAIEGMRILDTAIEADSKYRYDYVVKTQQGLFYTDTTLLADKPLTNKNLNGEYIRIKFVEEHYESHEEEYEDSDGNKKTRTVWEWEHYSTNYNTADNIILHENKYPTSMFELPSTSYIKTTKPRYHVRVKHYGLTNDRQVSFMATSNETGITNQHGKGKITLYNGDREALFTGLYNGERGATTIFVVFWIIISLTILVAEFYISDEN